MGVQSIRNHFIKNNPNVSLGECVSVQDCCRDIRIQFPSELGKVYSGFNTITDESEEWLCISIAKDGWKTKLQRVYRIERS
jgi:translation initiation factor 2 alpha subunit (eIF-2alpha)